jgi:hypothetical protein
MKVPALGVNKRFQNLLNDSGDKICMFSREIKLAFFNGMILIPILKPLRRARLFPDPLSWWMGMQMK